MAKKTKYYPISLKEIDIYKKEKLDKESRREEITNKALIELRKSWHKNIKDNKKLEFATQHFSKVIAMKSKGKEKENISNIFNYLLHEFSDIGIQ